MVEELNYDVVEKKDIIKKIKAGDIFVFPSDTVYCVGCNALKQGSVSYLRELMGYDAVFSIIAPSKPWISKNFKVSNKNYIKKLPGPFTYILEMKKRAVSKGVNAGSKFLGVKMPMHDFGELINKAKVPFVIVPVSSKKIVKEIDKIPRKIMKNVDYILNDGFLHYYPSSIIDLTGDMPRIVR